MSKIKIAICLSGEPRYWQRSVKTIHNFITGNHDDRVCKVDIFYHFWDNITKRQSKLIDSPIIEVVNKDDLYRQFKPTIGVCESKDSLDSYIDTAWDYIQDLKSKHDVTDTVNINCKENFIQAVKTTNCPPYSQIISMCKSLIIMSDYAEQNNINYDIIIRSRSDVEFRNISFEKIKCIVRKNKLSRYIKFPSISVRTAHGLNYNPFVEYCFFVSSSNIINKKLFNNFNSRLCELMFHVKPKKNNTSLIVYRSSHNCVALLLKQHKNKKTELGAGLDGFRYKLFQMPAN
jgi:hypothetical protein